MIVDKLIKVKINKKNINHYIKFYPDVKLKDIIDIDIEKHLLKGSNQKINVKCDICEISRLINFQSYNRNINSCPEYTIYSESQIMLSNGYYRIYDSGNTKWNLKL